MWRSCLCLRYDRKRSHVSEGGKNFSHKPHDAFELKMTNVSSAPFTANRTSDCLLLPTVLNYVCVCLRDFSGLKGGSAKRKNFFLINFIREKQEELKRNLMK